MHVDLIDDLETFNRLRSNWESVYASDPDAHILFSWTWCSIYFTRFQNDWMVMAARPESSAEYVAFFPIKLVTFIKENGEYHDEAWVAGTPRADYTGFVCRPEHQEEALPAIAERIKELSWTRLRLEFVHLSDKPLRHFLKPFSPTKYAIERAVHVINDTNNNICPFANLPGEWESYLASLSSNTRQKVKRFLRKVDEDSEFRITHATPQTFERDLDTLLGFWEVKWGPRYGTRTADFLSANRKLLPGLFDEGVAAFPVLWQGDTALGVLALLKDKTTRCVSYLLGGRDEAFNNPPPGIVLHAHSIRWAIANGFTKYDFMLGNHPFKFMFANGEFHVRSINVKPKAKLDAAGELDPRSLPFVLDKAKENEDAGKLVEAERAYRQVLRIDPKIDRALQLLADVTEKQGKLTETRAALKELLALRPADHAVWLRLGKTSQALGDFAGAAESYRKVLELDPANRDAHTLLSQMSRPTDLLRAVTTKMPTWMQE